jgi:hypothetical protein
VSWSERRYSPWLLKHEELLRHRQQGFARIAMFLSIVIALVEALLPWETLTPAVPHYIHIGVAAVSLPLLYLAWQADLRRKEQAFTLALSDKGRRLLFLDPYMEPEEFALSEQIQGAHVLPLQRQLDDAFKTGPGVSLHRRLESYYRTLPSPVHEGDRLGLLSFLHAGTFFTWFTALALCWIAMPDVGLALGAGSRGVSVLPLLVPLYLLAARMNTRYAYETAVFDWLRTG